MIDNYFDKLNKDQISRLYSLYISNAIPQNIDTAIKNLKVFFESENNIFAVISRLSREEKIIATICYFKNGTEESELLEKSKLVKDKLKYLLYLLELKLIIFRENNKYHLNKEFAYRQIFSFRYFFNTFEENQKLSAVNKNVINGIINYFYTNKIPKSKVREERYFQSSLFYSIFPGFDKEIIINSAKAVFYKLLAHGYFEESKEFFSLKIKQYNDLIKLNTISLYSYLIFDVIDYPHIKFFKILPYTASNDKNEGADNLLKLCGLLDIKPDYDQNMLSALCFVKKDDTGFLTTKPIQKDERLSNLRVNSDFNIYFTGTLSENVIASICKAEKIDTLSTYVIEKANVIKALDYYKSAEKIISELNLLNVDIPNIIGSRIGNWEEMYNKISLYEGLVLTASPQEAMIIKNLPLLKIHILKELSDTVFLMNKETRDQWKNILAYSGLDAIGGIKNSQDPLSYKKPEAYIDHDDYDIPLTDNEMIINADDPAIDSNLIINENQLTHLKNQTMTISGFDTRAKQIFLEKLLNERGKPVHVTIENEEFKAIVTNLYKEDKIYYTSLFRLSDEIVITVPVSKIYSLRALRF